MFAFTLQSLLLLFLQFNYIFDGLFLLVQRFSLRLPIPLCVSHFYFQFFNLLLELLNLVIGFDEFYCLLALLVVEAVEEVNDFRIIWSLRRLINLCDDLLQLLVLELTVKLWYCFTDTCFLTYDSRYCLFVRFYRLFINMYSL